MRAQTNRVGAPIKRGINRSADKRNDKEPLGLRPWVQEQSSLCINVCKRICYGQAYVHVSQQIRGVYIYIYTHSFIYLYVYIHDIQAHKDI